MPLKGFEDIGYAAGELAERDAAIAWPAAVAIGDQLVNEVELLRCLYDQFNARGIETLLSSMREDVVWANGGRLRPRARSGA
jgi:hypothetical protein